PQVLGGGLRKRVTVRLRLALQVELLERRAVLGLLRFPGARPEHGRQHRHPGHGDRAAPPHRLDPLSLLRARSAVSSGCSAAGGRLLPRRAHTSRIAAATSTMTTMSTTGPLSSALRSCSHICTPVGTRAGAVSSPFVAQNSTPTPISSSPVTTEVVCSSRPSTVKVRPRSARRLRSL